MSLNALTPAAEGPLSIPNLITQEAQVARAAEIQAIASQVANEKRTWRIGGVEYPFYGGPVARPGSLAETVQREQLVKFENPNSTALYQIILQSSFATEDGYQKFYENVATTLLPKPLSTDISDESFGYQRTTIKGFSMRAFKAGTDTYPSDPNLAISANVAKICDAKRTSLESVAKGNNMYVSHSSNFGQWSDPSKAGVKFVAAVVGFFCYNEDRQKLLPLAIRVVDPNLTYTPFDRTEE